MRSSQRIFESESISAPFLCISTQFSKGTKKSGRPVKKAVGGARKTKRSTKKASKGTKKTKRSTRKAAGRNRAKRGGR